MWLVMVWLHWQIIGTLPVHLSGQMTLLNICSVQEKWEKQFSTLPSHLSPIWNSCHGQAYVEVVLYQPQEAEDERVLSRLVKKEVYFWLMAFILKFRNTGDVFFEWNDIMTFHHPLEPNFASPFQIIHWGTHQLMPVDSSPDGVEFECVIHYWYLPLP